jgi:hypothetical protein
MFVRTLVRWLSPFLILSLFCHCRRQLGVLAELAQECYNAVKDGYSHDNNADEWFVCVLHKRCCFDKNIHSVNAEGEANSMPVERTFSA